MVTAKDLYDLEGNPFNELLVNTQYAWDALKYLKSYIWDTIKPNVSNIRNGNITVGKTLILYQEQVMDSGFQIDQTKKKPVVIKDGQILEGASIIYPGAILMDENIYIGHRTIIEPGALIKGPTIIGDNTEVRQGAYIRGECLIGNDCVVGHTTEMKSSILLGESKAGHFAYIGDSILGKVNLGAGTKLANLKILESKVTISINGSLYETGLRKFGSLLADGVETGCNSVTVPGTILSKNVLLYPNITARGYYPPAKIVKNSSQEIIKDIME